MEVLFSYLLKSAGILTIFFLAYKLLLQKETFFSLNRHYLIGGIITSLLLPFVVFTTYVYVEPVSETIFYDIPVTFTDTNEVVTTPFNWGALLFNIYIMGVIFIGTQFVMQLLSLYRIIKSGTIKNFGTYKLVEVIDDVSPFSFFNYIVYNPQNFSEKDLDVILNHEKAHSKQLHSIDILLSQLFVIFQWFNPIVWLYKKTIQQNLEFMADKAAITNINSKKNYQRTLLKVSVPIYCTSITNNFYNSLIKKRIVMLNQTSSKTRNLWKYSLILPALALFLMSFNTKTVEIIKENELAIKEIPDSNNLLPMESPIITPIKKEEASITSEKEEHPIVISKAQTVNDVIVEITKNTTKEELDNIERDLEKKGIEFSYSNLDFNSKGEITNIKIKYKDKEFGNSGSYHVNSDDDEPIKTIYIYTKDDGGFGIGNSPDGSEHAERMEAHAERLEEHKARIEEHKERVYEHKQRMKEHNETIKEEHEERMVEHRARMEEHKAEMEEKHEVRIKELKERREEMKVEKEERMHERKERLEERREIILKERAKHKVKGKKGNSFVVISDDDSQSNTFVYRTNSNENDGQQPLYVVDGEIMKNGDISDINPDDISSINVLKNKSATDIYGDDGKDGVIQIYTKKYSNSKKTSSKVILKGNKKVIYIVDDKPATKSFVDAIDTDNIVRVNVLKVKSATDAYGGYGKNGVVQIYTKEYSKPDKSSSKVILRDSKNAIYIVDDKPVSKSYADAIDTDNIASVNVIKGKSAIAIYGDDGKDGVIKIVTKSPNKIKYAYNTEIYSDITGTSEKMYFIEKSTTDRLLNSYKSKLKDQGIDFKFSGIKRNKNGEITRIKLRLDDNKGSKSSSTYDTSPNSIPTIMVGKKGNKMTISSN